MTQPKLNFDLLLFGTNLSSYNRCFIVKLLPNIQKNLFPYPCRCSTSWEEQCSRLAALAIMTSTQYIMHSYAGDHQLLLDLEYGPALNQNSSQSTLKVYNVISEPGLSHTVVSLEHYQGMW